MDHEFLKQLARAIEAEATRFREAYPAIAAGLHEPLRAAGDRLVDSALGHID